MNNHRFTQGLPPVRLSVRNNNYNIPMSFIEHRASKNIVADMYRRGYPHPLTGQQGNITDVADLSKFLQTRTWFPCQNNPKCEKSHIVHRPDLAVTFREPVVGINNVPFRIPIFITEVEGSKDGWGRFEQEGKALEEAVTTLAFMPDIFLLFIYHNRFEIWYVERNPAHGCIDVTSYPTYIQVGGEAPFGAALDTIIDHLTGILVRQLVRNGPILTASMASFRASNLQPYYDPPPGQGTPICNNCWVLPGAATASAYVAHHTNQGNVAALPTFE